MAGDIILVAVNKKVLDFLGKNRVGVLAVQLKDKSPHAAAMHYSHLATPLEIYIQTENTSRKCQAIIKGGTVRAAFVVGFSEEEFKTLQINGNIKVVSKSKLPSLYKVHYKKHPDAKKWKDDPATVFLVFKPTWWRYTEYKPKLLVLSS